MARHPCLTLHSPASAEEGGHLVRNQYAQSMKTGVQLQARLVDPLGLHELRTIRQTCRRVLACRTLIWINLVGKGRIYEVSTSDDITLRNSFLACAFGGREERKGIGNIGLILFFHGCKQSARFLVARLLVCGRRNKAWREREVLTR